MSGQREESRWPLLLAIWLSFVLYGAVAAPIPGVNEPHYLCKSKHFWQPDWCANDFFLKSPNAHTVFYATAGSLTKLLPLNQAAWLGRLLAMLILAWGWTRCFSQIFLTPWSVLWSSWIYLAFAACGNFSGEWLVGGVEGKVFCYGFLLAALGDVFRERWLYAATWAGLAVSFHPVVGVWALLAYAFSAIVVPLAKALFSRRSISPGTEQNFNLIGCSKTVVAACVIFVTLSLPGMIPVIRLLLERVPEETRYAGTYIQVFFRLAHHLDPMMFPRRSYICYALLIGFWICGFRWGGRTNSKILFDRIVVWAVLFAIAGILIGYGPRPASKMPYFAERMNLLKFYPFRLGDLLVPVAVSVSLICVLERSCFGATFASVKRLPHSLSPIIMLVIYLASLGRAYSMTETNRYSGEDRVEWLDVCHWLDANLPRDALVQSPTNGWAFKWFAQRAEFVAYKDCPQDAAGIVEWNRRLNFLQRWYERNYSDEIYSANELRDLQKETGITHLLVDHLGPMELEPIYKNKTFKVYDLNQLAAQDTSQ